MTGTFHSSTGHELFGVTDYPVPGGVNLMSQPGANYSVWPSAVVVDRQVVTSSNLVRIAFSAQGPARISDSGGVSSTHSR